MTQHTKEELQARLRIESVSGLWYGKLPLLVEGFGATIEVSISLASNSPELTSRAVQTINDVAALNSTHQEHILQLLFDDAMYMKSVATWNSRQPANDPPKQWLRRIFWRRPPDEFVALMEDDPRHPLFGIASPMDIASRIKWEDISLDDSEGNESTLQGERFAFLTCYPPWELEHGREIAICNGVPIGIGEISLNEYNYRSPEDN